MADLQEKRRGAKRKALAVPRNVAGLSALYSGVLQKIGAVEEANSALENKLAAILAGNLIVLTFVITAIIDPTHSWHELSMFGAYSLVVSISYCLVGSWPGDHASSTVDVRKDKYQDYVTKSDEMLLRQLIADSEHSNDKLKPENSKKAKAYRFAAGLFIIGTGLCLLSFFVNTPKI